MIIQPCSTGHASLKSSIAALRLRLVGRLAIDVIDGPPQAAARGAPASTRLSTKSERRSV